MLRATYDSILEVGVRRTTLADVARRAGVSRMTVYRRYEDLPSLVSAVLRVELAEVIASAQSEATDLPTQRARISAALSRTAIALIEHPLLSQILSLDPEALVPFMVDRLGSTQRTALQILREMIKEGQDGDQSVRAGDRDSMALTLLIAMQSFVFSARAVATADPLNHVHGEIEILVNNYLAPSPA